MSLKLIVMSETYKNNMLIEQRTCLEIYFIWAFLLRLCGVTAMGRAEYYELGNSQEADLQKNFIISLRNFTNPKQRLCLGTLISSKLALTSAHCIVNRNGNRLQAIVVAGTLMEDFQNDPKSVQRNISNIFVHPSYEYNAASNDLAILELNESLEYYDTNMTSAILADRMPEYPECYIYGWGCAINDTKPYNKLRKRIVYGYDRAECQKRYGSSFYKNEFCADFFGKIFCGNDTGGPLICENRLVAVVSYISDQDVYPNLFMVVSRHIGFIHNPVNVQQFYSKARKPTVPITGWKLLLDTFIFILVYNV